MTFTILDLYCGEGGAAEGYRRAGFSVIGVDNVPQPRYPFPFYQFDALKFLDGIVGIHPGFLRFDAIHASPPCQHYSKASKCRPGLAAKYPDLIPPTRERLEAIGLPYVLENVLGAPLNNPITLCGSQFGLQAWWPGKGRFGLMRHRLIETNWPLPDAGPHDHSLRSLPVYGHNPGARSAELRGPGFAAASRKVMGISWMTRDGLNEALPPAYTEYVGRQLRMYLREREAA